MRVYEYYRDDGYFKAFEIDNAYIRPKKIVELLNGLEGVTEVYVNSLRKSNDVRVGFKYLGIEFIVWEPFGDNSRYWIGMDNDAKRETSNIDISPLANTFRQYQPPYLRKLFGDLITLNFKSILRA